MLKLKSTAFSLVLFLALSLTLISFGVEAKTTLSLDFYKDNGYGMGEDMNGEWTLNTVVSQDVQYVEFYLDNQLQLNDTSSPFSWNFNTGSYSEAQHTLKAVAYNSLGETATAESQHNFVGFPLTFVVGIIGLVVVLTVGSFGFALYRARKKEKEHQKNHQN